MNTNDRHGFTIVELLIVIVVIGILAGIAIISYVGIQDRAYNAKALSIANSYEKALIIYKAKKGSYPAYPNDSNSDVWVCLGTPAQYPAKDGFAAGACETWGGPTVVADADFMTEVSTVTGNVVSGELPVIDYGGGRARGVQFHQYGKTIDYYVKGTQVCPKGDRLVVHGSTRCVIPLE